MPTHLNVPVSTKELSNLSVGETVFLSGTLCTARDEAYRILLETDFDKLPFDLDGKPLYHCGPLMKKRKNVWEVIAAGPTTSGRMDSYSKAVLEKFPQLNILIGKGNIGDETIQALKDRGVYLVYTGGAAALAADQIKEVLDVFWLDELGMAEAVWLLSVVDFGPMIVAIDTNSHSIFDR